MRKFALLTLLALASPALAEDLTADSMLGTTAEEVKTKLTEMGYEVRKVEAEDGKIEAYFVKEGKMGEVYVDPASGKITELSMK